MSWFLNSDLAAKIEDARANITSETIAASAEYDTNYAARDDGIMRVAGENALIKIEGVLTEKPDFFASFFGGGNTVYSDIITAIAQANADSSIKKIILDVNSGGGSIAGMFDAVAAIQSSKKKITANVTMAASAAYALIASANTIAAKSKASSFGSIGVVTSRYINDDVVDITSTNAPNKRPDAGTEEGKAVIREELDAIHELMTDTIAAGRGTTIANINANFGKGGMFLAKEALNRGMIDSVSEQSGSKSTTAPRGNKMESNMDLATLKAEHPAVYAQAVADGEKLGAANEKDRVSAHLIMGETSGDMATASAAIQDGSEMTATLQAKYMAAGMNKASINARENDDTDAADNADNAEQDTEATEKEKEAKASAAILANAASGLGVDLQGAK